MNIPLSHSQCNPEGAKLRLLRYSWLGWLFIISSIWMAIRTHRGASIFLLETYAIASGLMLIGLIQVYPFVLDLLTSSYWLAEGVVNKPMPTSRSTTPGRAIFIMERYFINLDSIQLRATKRDYTLLISGRKYRICYAQHSRVILKYEEII